MGVTVSGQWVGGSNLQLLSLNDGIVICDPSRAAGLEPCVSRFEGAFLSGSSWRLIVHSVHASSSGLSVLR
ncbi:hypothetical protein DY000_02035003 [Brassica cretica]|uniref:Uncharacterized protein n=1 Tax=Brassica cretica TaxID=69181 RepID=A0ABQ7DP14_BRACR|nr:hypothetical protein DY000_02035003 [Brassica cretica]